MGSNTESIGTVSIDLTSDYSGLISDFMEVENLATKSGTEIAQSFATAAAGADTFDQKVQTLVDGGATLAEAMATVQGSATAAGEALDGMAPPAAKFSEAAQSIIDKQQALEDKAASLASALTELYDGYNSGTVSAEALANAQEQLANASAKAYGPIHDSGDATKQVGAAATEAGIGVDALMSAFTKITGVAIGADALLEFAKAGLETYESLEKADIAITALTGNAAAARDQIESFISIAQSDALSLPGVVEAGQRMAAAGLDAQQINSALQAAADTAAATGRSFDSVSAALYRVVESGMVGGRQLLQLGVNAQQLADVVGTTTANLAKDWKDMDPSDRLDAIEQALSKFSGTAALVADTVGGQWQKLKTSAELGFAGIAEAIAPAAKEVLGFLNDTVIPMVAGAVSSFQDASHAVQQFSQTTDSIIEDAARFVGLGKAAQDTATGMDAASRAADGLNHAILDGEPPMTKLSDLWKAAGPNLKDFAAGLGLVNDAMQLLTGHAAALPGIIGTLTDATSKGAKAATDYGAQLRANWEEVTSGSAQTAKLTDAQTKADDAFTAAQASLKTLTELYKEHKTTADGVAVTQDLLTRAQNDVNKAFDAAHPILQASKNDVKDLTSSFKDFMESMTSVGQYLGVLHDEQGSANTELEKAKGLISDLTEDYHTDAAALSDLSKGVDIFWQAWKAANPTLVDGASRLRDNAAATQALRDATKDLTDQYVLFQPQAKSAADIVQSLTSKQEDAVQAAHNHIEAYIELSKTYELDSPIMTKAMEGVTKALKDSGMTLDDLIAKPGQWSTQVINAGKIVQSSAQDSAAALRHIAEAMDPDATAAAQVLVGHVKNVADAAKASADSATGLAPAIASAQAPASDLDNLLTNTLKTLQDMGDITVADTSSMSALAEATQGVADAAASAASAMAGVGNFTMGSLNAGGGGGRGGGFGNFQMMDINHPEKGGWTLTWQPGAGVAQAPSETAVLTYHEPYSLTTPTTHATAAATSTHATAAAATTSSTTGNSLIDWLNAFTAAVGGATSTATAATTTLPDWLTQLDTALKSVASSTSAGTTTLPDWVNQLAAAIQSATSGSLLDLTQLGASVQSILAAAVPATAAVAQFGQTLGTAGIAATQAASTIASAATSLYDMANYKPPSFTTSLAVPSAPVAPSLITGHVGFERIGPPQLYTGGIQPMQTIINVNNPTIRDQQSADYMVNQLRNLGVR